VHASGFPVEEVEVEAEVVEAEIEIVGVESVVVVVAPPEPPVVVWEAVRKSQSIRVQPVSTAAPSHAIPQDGRKSRDNPLTDVLLPLYLSAQIAERSRPSYTLPAALTRGKKGSARRGRPRG
jgi:hypothetical protein